MATTTTNSHILLGIFAAAALLAFVAVENSKQFVRLDWYEQKLEAATRAKAATRYLKNYQLERGVFIDAINDPNETALIGQEFTPITTDVGYIDAKLTSTNPNFAGVVVELLKQAGLKEGDVVAVAVSGSFPALNIATLSALETMKLTPLVTSSVGSSSWGANDPEFTWLDMERVLNEAGICHIRSLAASVGGEGDVGRGLSPEGRGMILRAIKRNKVEFISEEHLESSIQRRLKLYEEKSAGHPIKAYISIGGDVASLGAPTNGDIIPDGLSKTLPVKNYPVRGVIIEMGRRGVPIIHLHDIKKLLAKYDLPENPVPMPEPGTGGIFVREKFNLTVVWVALLLLSLMIVAAAYVDRRKPKLGTEPLLGPSAATDPEL